MYLIIVSAALLCGGSPCDCYYYETCCCQEPTFQQKIEHALEEWWLPSYNCRDYRFGCGSFGVRCQRTTYDGLGGLHYDSHIEFNYAWDRMRNPVHVPPAPASPRAVNIVNPNRLQVWQPGAMQHLADGRPGGFVEEVPAGPLQIDSGVRILPTP